MNGLTKAQKRAIAIKDNGAWGEWDFDLLSSQWADLPLSDWGITLPEDWLTQKPEIIEDEPQIDRAAELQAEWGTALGQIWQLGEHRIMCGNSIKKEDVAALMGDKRAVMVFTDPPYNVDYGSSKNPRHKIRSIKQDNQTTNEWIEFNRILADNIKRYSSGDVYVWGASGPEGMRQRLILIESGIHWSATIIWKKQQLVLSPAKYQRIYEPCFYGWIGISSFRNDRKQLEVWEFDRPLHSKDHPTMKPVALCACGINNSCEVSQIVLDLFLGSGSTLIACEQTNRICYGMEIDPAYVAISLQRWKDFTGKEPFLVKNKK